jgi:hypothetical protein
MLLGVLSRKYPAQRKQSTVELAGSLTGMSKIGKAKEMLFER